MNGKKTYIVAAGAVLGAISGVLTGTVSIEQAAQLALTAILGATIRHGVSTATAPKSEG